MKSLIYYIICLLSISACVAAEQVGAHIVHFPKERSMGMLYVLNANQIESYDYDDWEPLCEARGDVTVPAGKVLRLDLDERTGEDLSPLSKLEPNDLFMLYCYSVEFADEQLQNISHLTGLRQINLHDTGILGTGLKYLTDLKSLECLDLKSTHTGDEELAYLLDLPNLKILHLWGTPVTDAGMIHVGKVTSMESLSLNEGVGEEGLSHLKNLTKLKDISIHNPAVSDESMQILVNFKHLEIMHLNYAQISNEGLACLKDMKKLKQLYVFSRQITNDGLVHLKDLEHLEYLSLSLTITETGLEHLSNLGSLQNIRIDVNTLTPRGLELLSRMKSLEQVTIVRDQKRGYNTDEVVKVLAKSFKLKSLSVHGGLTDDGLMQLKDMKSLEELDISDSQITSKGFSALAELPSLRELNLSRIELPDEECWVSLGKITSLERLILSRIRSKISDENIANLTGLQNLKDLTISSSYIVDKDEHIYLDITEKGLLHISKLRSLEVLWLSGARITDKELRHLANLPALKWLVFNNCKVSEHDLLQLKKKNPALGWNIW